MISKDSQTFERKRTRRKEGRSVCVYGCVGEGGASWRASVSAPAPPLDHRWLIVRPAPLIAAIFTKTPRTLSWPAKRMTSFMPLTRHVPCLFLTKFRKFCPLFPSHSARLLPKKSCISINFTLPSGGNASPQEWVSEQRVVGGELE